MPRHKALDEILSLDPERDHLRIGYLIGTHEFPWDLTRSLEFALFRTYAVPSISALLDRTGEFLQRPQKRYDDTDIIISTFYEHGCDSEVGRAAMRRMNQQHRRYTIPNDDFLYVLSTLVYEPIRWIDRFGYRPMVEQERLAQFYLWREVGRRMNIPDIPADFDTFERFNIEYERDNFRYTDANRRVGLATRDLFLGWFLPRSLYPLGAPAVYALMDDRLLDAFGFPRPPAAIRAIVQGSLRARSRVVRMLPERRRPRLRTQMKHRSYPQGHSIEMLGAPDFVEAQRAAKLAAGAESA